METCNDDSIISLPLHELETEGPVVFPHSDKLSAMCGGQRPDWGHRLLDLSGCWRKHSCTGKGVTVAVLDTGVDGSHPDLTISRGRDFTGSSRGWSDVQGHGTHCAGIIAARNNDLGVVGAAPDATLIAGKVLSDSGSGAIRWIAAGIHWAISEKADVISMSLGGGGHIAPVLQAALDAAIRSGAIVVVAAGNSGPYEGTVGSPGNYKPCVTVAAVDMKGNVARFSSRGGAVDIGAPGVRILSTYPNGRYTQLSGTSMATPYVAGIAALFVEKARKCGVTPSQSLFEKLIKETALDRGAPGFDTSYGEGIVQPTSLLERLESLGTPTILKALSSSSPIGTRVRLTCPNGVVEMSGVTKIEKF
jgi:subtilisin